jgi:hypothetical protein
VSYGLGNKVIIMYVNAIPEAVVTFMNQVVPYFYQNSVGNMGIKLYNKLLEKRIRLHSLIILNRQLKSKLLQNVFIV